MSSFTPQKGMSAQEQSATIDAILIEATLPEKIGMMSGKGFFRAFQEDGGVWAARPYRAGGGIERLGLEPFYFTDGPRGVARGNSTCFPCSMARGASFDPDLEHRIGQVMGIEARAQGCTLSGAVCFNLLRHPSWGRAQETYGEDPYHLGIMGASLGTGIQTHNVCATVKHYALNSMENTRFTVDVTIDERSLHEVYLPHFKMALDAGVASVMSAYNKMNGEYCGQHRILLTDVLRGEWGFDGFVHSDWVKGVYQPYGATAGLDVENPEPIVFGKKLEKAVEEGHVEPQAIDQACRRILKTYFRFACAEDPLPEYTLDHVACADHIALALEAAEKSAVLLSNASVLPLDKKAVKRLAVLGRLAAIENTGDNGSSRVRPPYVVTAVEGLSRYLGAEAIITGDECDLQKAKEAAKGADAVVVVVGYTAQEEGEFIPGDIALGQVEGAGSNMGSIGGDRDTLSLPPAQTALIETAVSSGKPVAVVIVAGSAVMVEGWHDKVGAILQTFYAGMEGGTALARIIFGDVSPSAKLPFTVASDADDYPWFDKTAEAITYDYWHGYTKFDREKRTPRYAFGHGLSYTSFAYRGMNAAFRNGNIQASIAVTNKGDCSADEVVQCYIGFPNRDAERPKKLLKGFQRVSLKPGETRVVHFSVPLDQLAWRDPATHQWRDEHGEYTVFVGGSSDQLTIKTVSI